MGKSIAEYREELATLRTESQTLIDKVASDGARKFTDEEQGEQDKRFERMEAIQSLLDEQTRFARFAATGQDDDKKFANDKKPAIALPSEPPGRDAAADKSLAFSAEEAADAVTRWAASGEIDRKFATITTATQSGIYLPRSIAPAVLPSTSNSFRDAINVQGMQQVSIVTTTDAVDLKVPVVTGSAGGKVAENASSETENTPSLSESISLTVDTYQSGSVYYSNKLLAAGSVNIVSNVTPTLQYEKELGLESDIAATLIADTNVTQTVTLTGIAASGLTYAKMVELNRKLPKRFDSKKVILLSDAAYTAAEQLTDSNGQPILNRDAQNQELVRFNGTPVIRSTYFEAFGASKVVGVIISLLGFRLRDVDGMNLARYTQVPAKPDQTGFNLFAYHAYGYAASAVAKLKTSAS